MKKKILIVIIVFLLLFVLIVSFTTSSFLKDSISFVTIENGFLSDKIDLLSQVESEIKYQFFNGFYEKYHYQVGGSSDSYFTPCLLRH